MDEVLNILDKIIQTADKTTPINYYKSQSLFSIASALAQYRKIDESSKIFDKSIGIAKTIDYYQSRSRVLSSIASALAQSGKIDEFKDGG